MYCKTFIFALLAVLAFENVCSTPIKDIDNTESDIKQLISFLDDILTNAAITDGNKATTAQYDVNVLGTVVLDAADDVSADMIKVAYDRVNSLKQQAEEANVDASDCFIGIKDKLNDATETPLSGLETCVNEARMQAANEVQIVHNLLQSALTTVTSDENALVECKGEKECLENLLELVTTQVTDLPNTLNESITKSVNNIKSCGRSFIKCDNVAVSDAQYKVGRVVGLLDKCVHETIFH